MSFVQFANDWGNTITVISFPVAIIGLIITFNQARNSANYAKKAKDLAQEAVSNIVSFLLITEVGDAAELADDLVYSCRQHQWELAIDRSMRLRKTMASLLDSNLILQHEHDAIISFNHTLKQSEEEVSRISKSNSQKPPKIKDSTIENIMNIAISLNRIAGRLSSKLTEVG